MSINLQTPIDYLKGVGPNRADLLRQELGIHTYQDLINLFPNRYIDRTRYYKVNQLQRNNADVQVVGIITGFKEVAQKRGKRLVATFQDDTGVMELVWFRGQKWIRESLKLNRPYVACLTNTKRTCVRLCSLFILPQKSYQIRALLIGWLARLCNSCF